MLQLDFIVMAVFAVLILVIGFAFTRQSSQNSSAFFEAGGETPWWINGLSLFISYFSAGTFVVWGSIAYKHGAVANMIQFTMCLGGLFTAIFVAVRWKRTGALTAAEYIGKRFGNKTQQFYTYLILLYSLFSTGAVLYPVGKMVYVATPFSLETCIIAIGLMVILYTAAGGLWAVLATDVVQFVILTAAVLIVIPMAFSEVKGVNNFIQQTPANFFHPFNEEYTFGFMLAFLLYQSVYIAGNWSYVQRYTSVSNEKNARKVAYLFAGLYLVSPSIWMLPPMIYRVINPNLNGLDTEGAYMMLCQKVLPAGLIGLVLSGMISATASKANSTINIAAVVFTHDIYKGILHKTASDKTMILVARLFTVLFGFGTIGIALLVPKAGGIVEVVLSTAAIAGGSLFAPIIWSLFSKRQTAFSLVTVSLISLAVSFYLKIINPVLTGFKLNRTFETTIGVGLPLLLLACYELYARRTGITTAWLQMAPTATTSKQNTQHDEAVRQNRFGIRVIAAAIGFVGVGIFVLGMIAQNGHLAAVIGLFIVAIAIPIWRVAGRLKSAATSSLQAAKSAAELPESK